MFYFSLRKQTFGHPERRNRAAVECAASATTGRPALLAYMVSTHDRNFPIATKRRFMDARGNGREPLYTASSRTWKGEARHSKPMLNICLYYIAGSCGRKPINCKETEGAFLRTRMLLLAYKSLLQVSRSLRFSIIIIFRSTSSKPNAERNVSASVLTIHVFIHKTSMNLFDESAWSYRRKLP